MYKINKYVKFIVDGKYSIIFNLQTEIFIVLAEELAKVVNDNKQNIDAIKTLHPDLFKQMIDSKIIIPFETDETKELVKLWEEEDRNPSYFSMIINPTLGCNLRCWYCYEKHDKKPIMSEDTLSSIRKLIDKKVSNKELKDLNISFFGGEPLLGFDKIIKPLIIYASQRCKENKIHLSSNFTTNGVLLSSNVLDFLKSATFVSLPTFQISLDGNRVFHNKSRVGINKQPTYDTIIANIKEAIHQKFSISIRLNYTSETILSFSDILDDFLDLDNNDKEYIHFNFQQIWQDITQHSDIQNRVDYIKDLFNSKNYMTESYNINTRQCCYADKENCVVINADGNIFKCTAREFIANKREGELSASGEISWNEKFHNRMKAKYNNKKCLDCIILPICNGGCSQNKLEANNTDKCSRNMNEDDKSNYIIKRLQQIIKKQQDNHLLQIKSKKQEEEKRL